MRSAARHVVAAPCRTLATNTRVLISGGGPAGIVTALALGRAGTPCVLVEPQTAPSAHPRAHVLTARTFEICEDLGLGDALKEIAPPLERWRQFRYCDRVDGADYAIADHGAAPAWAWVPKCELF